MGALIVAMIPARMGSERLKCKNLRLLSGKPVIAHAIDAAKDSGIFSRIVVNSEHEAFGEVADRYGVEFYQRPIELGSPEARSDDVVADFMSHHPADLLVWVNPIAPLQPASEIRDAVSFMQEGAFDTVITTKREYLHSLFRGQPLNFSCIERFAKTQDLEPVESFVYSLMMWNYASFQESYRQKGYAVLSGKVGYYPVARQSTILIKYEEDLRICEALLRMQEGYKADYDPVLSKVAGNAANRSD
jgi:CMP-N-acetylneuraminic acid synthetase